MRNLLAGAAILWLASALVFLITWDWSPDRFIEWASALITLGGIVLGFLGVIFVIVAAVRSGHQEKKQWE
ncbi:MAG TPA: hypothetical protein VH968_08565 [Gaiellaceae bacterium]|jgi:hypothetical protein